IRFSFRTRASRVQQERTTRTASNRSERARVPRARSLTARRKFTDRSMSSITCPSSSSSCRRRPAATSVQRPTASITSCSPARAAVSGFDSSWAIMPGSVVMSCRGSARRVGAGAPSVGSRRTSRPRRMPASARVSRSRLRRSRPSGGGAGGRSRTGAITQAPSGAARLPIQRLPWTMGMCQRRGGAAPSGLRAGWAGPASPVACGSGSARAEPSHTVTGRPPRARLACRSTSRLPSAYVSARVTAAPWRTLPPGGRPKGAAPDGASVESGGRVLHMRRPRRPVKQRSGRPGVYGVSPRDTRRCGMALSRRSRSLALATTVISIACGGGGGGTPPPQNALAKAPTSGDGQVVNAGQTLPNPLAVIVKDPSGNPVNGGTITWAPTLDGGTVGSSSSTTGADGIATTTLATGSDSVVQKVTASGANLSGSPVTFAATARIQGATELAFASPSNNGQTDTVLAMLKLPYRAILRDENNAVVPNVTVTWTAVGGGSVNGSGTTTTTSGSTG